MKKIIALSIVNVLLGYGLAEAYPVPARAVPARPAPAVRATPAPRPAVRPSTPAPAPKQRATPSYENRGFTPLTPNTVIVPRRTKGDEKDEE